MFFVGVDLGQKVDFSAIAIVEREDAALAWMPPVYRGLRVRYLERVALGTPYTGVAEHVEEVVCRTAAKGRCELVVDATGVGVPVVDLLRNARLPCGMTAVTITSGERAKGSGQWVHVPKKDLLAVVQVALEKGELQIARKLRDAGLLVKELVHLGMSKRPSGVKPGAAGGGEHDDLAMAVALACWASLKPQIGYGTQRLPGI